MTSFSITDIHNHLVPAVDDGAQSIEESLRHLTTLHSEGVGQLSVSPHLFGWLTEEEGGLELRLDRLEEAYAELETVCAGRSDVPRLFFGQEILCPTPEIAVAVFKEPRAGYRGTSYALVEFGFELKGDVREVIKAVLASGRRMIISHPERYRRQKTSIAIDELREWQQLGGLLQINAGSLMGDYGSSVGTLAWQALREGLGSIIATDHHADSRVVSPGRLYEILNERGLPEQAKLLMSENPASVLADREIFDVPGF